MHIIFCYALDLNEANKAERRGEEADVSIFLPQASEAEWLFRSDINLPAMENEGFYTTAHGKLSGQISVRLCPVFKANCQRWTIFEFQNQELRFALMKPVTT